MSEEQKIEVNFSLVKFDEKEAELKLVVAKYENIQIKGVGDTGGYALADAGRKALKVQRRDIEILAKSMRDVLNNVKNKIKTREDDLVEIVKPLEKKLEAQQDEYNLAVEKEKRKELLPDRRLKLAEIEVKISDEEIIAMDATEFQTFRNVKYSEFLAKKEAKAQKEREDREAEVQAEKDKLKVAQDKLDEDKRQLEVEKQLEAEKKKAREDEQEKAKEDARLAKIQAEQDKQDAIEAERKKAQDEKDARLAKEASDKKAKEDLEAKEKEDADKIKKQEDFKKFLIHHEYTEETKHEFYLSKTDKLIILYKKVGEFIIK